MDELKSSFLFVILNTQKLGNISHESYKT